MFSATADGLLADDTGKPLVPLVRYASCPELPNNFSIAGRAYLNLAVKGLGAKLFSPASRFSEQKIVVQRLHNLLDARLTTQLATRCGKAPQTSGLQKDDRRRIVSADVLLASVDHPILPLNLQFSVFDLRTGTVLFHSDDERVLIEDVFREIQPQSYMGAAVRARKAFEFGALYRGKSASFAFEPVADLDWGVLVYSLDEPVDGIFYACVAAAVGLTFGVILLAFAPLLQLWLVLAKLRASSLFWPQWRLRALYLPISLLLLLFSIGLGVWAELMPSPVIAVVAMASVLLLSLVVALAPPEPPRLGLIKWSRLLGALGLLVAIAATFYWLADTLRQLLGLAMMTLASATMLLVGGVRPQQADNGAPVNPWRRSPRLYPAALQALATRAAGRSAEEWSAFSIRYCLFLASLFFTFAGVPGWKFCSFVFDSWRMDTELVLERATQAQVKLRYDYLLSQKLALIGHPFHPGQFDAVRGRWLAGVHPRAPDGCAGAERRDPDCSFGFAKTGENQIRESEVGRLTWPAAAKPGAALAKSAPRPVSNTEASPLLRIFKNQFSQLHPVAHSIGMSAAAKPIASGPAGRDAIRLKNATYRLPDVRGIRLLQASLPDGLIRRSVFAVTVVGGGALLFMLLWMLDARLFGSRLLWSGRIGPQGAPEATASPQTRFVLVVRAAPEESRRFLSSRDEVVAADLAAPAWPAFTNRSLIWIEGLDQAVRSDAASRQRALVQLEKLVATPGEFTVCLTTDCPPLHFLSRPEAYPKSAKLPAEVGVDERLRWAILFSSFAKCYRLIKIDDDLGHLRREALKLDPQITELVDRETRLFWPEMIKLRGRLLKIGVGRAASGDPLNERDVVEAVEMEHGALMRRHWETLTTQERLVMKQLADGCFANPGNGLAILHLLRRGLIVGEPHLMIKSEALQLFVLQAETDDNFNSWQAATPESPWLRYRIPILVGAGLFVMITGWVTLQSVQLFNGWLAALTAALGLFAKASASGKTETAK